MNKSFKLNQLPVKNDKSGKISVDSVELSLNLKQPDFMDACPLNHVYVTLVLSDGNKIIKGYDYIPDCPLDKYVQISMQIFNSLQNASIDSSK